MEFSPQTQEKFAVPQVLIVDDEALIRWSLAKTLTRAGYTVREAGDARETVRLLQAGPAPDVVVLDYRLPDSKDLTLLATVRHLAPDSQVIFMTAYGTADVRQRASALGAREVVTKPFEMDEMTALIRQAHDSRQP